MRVLLIHCHPRQDSFSAALRDAAVDVLTSSGHSVEMRDLYAEAFDPVLSAHQRGVYFDEAENVRGVEDHVAALRQAEGLVLVYPTWWFGMPAMLKGWLDRVFVYGRTYTGRQRYDRGLQINEAMFVGSGGWVVKPDRLRGIKPFDHRRPVRLTCELIAGCNSKSDAPLTRHFAAN